MVWLYTCEACENGNHGACEQAHPAPKGQYGGRLCRCPCRGNPQWNTPEFHQEELQKITQEIIDHQNATEKLMKSGNLPDICESSDNLPIFVNLPKQS